MPATHTCTEANLSPDTAALQAAASRFHTQTTLADPPVLPIRCENGSYHLWSPTHRPDQPLPTTEPPPAAALEPLLDHTTKPGDFAERLQAFHTDLEHHLSCQAHIELYDPLGFALPWCHVGETQTGAALPLVGLSGTRYGTLTLPAYIRPSPQDWWLITTATLLLPTIGRDIERERGPLLLHLAHAAAEAATLEAAAHHLEQTLARTGLPMTCRVEPGARLAVAVRTDSTSTHTDIPLPNAGKHLRLCHQPSYDSWIPPTTELELLGAYLQAIEERNAAAAAAHTHLTHLTATQIRDTVQTTQLLHELRNHTAALLSLLDLFRTGQHPQPALLDNLERTATRLATVIDTPTSSHTRTSATATTAPGVERAAGPKQRGGPVDLPA